MGLILPCTAAAVQHSIVQGAVLRKVNPSGARALKGEVQEERGLLCYLSRAQLRDLGVFSMQEMDPAQSVCS